jgi:hypothetical protein
MKKTLSRQVQKSIEFSELYDNILRLAGRYKLNDEVSNILSGRLRILPNCSDDQASLDELNKLNATMEELNEHGAQKKLDPTTINSAELQATRRAAIREFEKLERDIKAKSRQLGNIAGVYRCETPQERDERWQHEVPRTQKQQKCSTAAAIRQVAQEDRSLGRQVPKDPNRTYYRAKAAK